MPDVILVVDMVRGFLEPGHNLYCGDASREIIAPIRRLAERELAGGGTALFLCDHHDPDDLEFKMFPVHCVKGTHEPEVIPELAGLVKPGHMIPKNRYSGFFNTDLAERLRRLRPEKLLLCGVCTDICVLHTAADARNRDYTVEVPADCVASFSQDNHRWALKHLKEILGAQVV